MMEVRNAKEDELPLVRKIMQEAFEEYRGVLEPPSGALTETLGDVRASAAKGGAVLAFLDSQPVGSARYELRGDYLYCWRLSVIPSARGRGIAAAMLEHVHRQAAEAGLPEVRLSTREVMEANQRLYLRLGYEVMSRQLHPKGEGYVLELAKRIQ
ncbi:MAG: hypothetical protein HONBIEJF_01048 [Fimbriimonadaceae bacterium]|nr:hypothetical protein [Fimbriimonadaceae bacterium]